MKKDTVVELKKRVGQESRSALDEVLRKGAQDLLQEAIKGEVAEYIDWDEAGHRLVVRNGSMPQRGVGDRGGAGEHQVAPGV